MPKKPNKSGLQEYIPAGNGDASGEYADEGGSNIHYFSKFNEPSGVVKSISSKFEDLTTDFIEDNKYEDIDKDIELDIEEPKDSFNDLETDFTEDELKETFDNLHKDFEEIEIDFNKPKEKKDQEIKKFIKQNKDTVKKLGAEKTKDILVSTYADELDIEKVKQLDDKQVEDLAVAINVLNNKGDYLAQFSSVKSDFINSISKDEVIGGTSVWKNIPDNLKDFETSLDSKIDYFSNIAENGVTDEIKELANKKLEALQKLKNSPELEKWRNADKTLSYDFSKYQKLVDKYENPDNVYSQKAKDKAKWYKDMSSASAKYSPYAKNVIDYWKQNDPKALEMVKDYTGSYSSINSPLRATDYPHKESYPEQSKQKQKQFIEHIEGMTKVIDSSTYDFNCWVQRGVDKINIGNKELNYYSTLEDVNSIVGTTFQDQGFLSCGSHKGGGFSSSNIIMNIYCPAGTKMLYVKDISHFKSEDETIIQRGYSYRITKAEKKNGMIYFDCEVILGSDSQKYGKKELEEIKEKYF